MSLVIKDLKVRVGTFQAGLDYLEVTEGQIACLIGKSGSGKSTLLNAIAGFLPIENGEIHVGKESLHLLLPERRRVGIVFQKATLFPHLCAWKNVAFSLGIRGVPVLEQKRLALLWMDKLDIGELSEYHVGELSGGQAQRVALARVFITGFPVLLMDEPFSALDVTLRSSLRSLLKNLVCETKTSVIMVSHDPQDVVALADWAVVLDKGKVVQSGTVKTLQTAPKDPVVSELICLRD